MVNVKNIDRLIAAIEAEQAAPRIPFFFNMSEWLSSEFSDDADFDENLNPCGTAACIGGTAELLMAIDEHGEENIVACRVVLGDKSMSAIADWIGISKEDADELFFVTEPRVSLEVIRKHHALAALRAIREKGCFTTWLDYIEPELLRDDG